MRTGVAAYEDTDSKFFDARISSYRQGIPRAWSRRRMTEGRACTPNCRRPYRPLDALPGSIRLTRSMVASGVALPPPSFSHPGHAMHLAPR